LRRLQDPARKLRLNKQVVMYPYRHLEVAQTLFSGKGL
jgi:hypothetical protein